MANLSKKWGAVIGCWAVALVLIVTGICLGLVIPSRAAEDAYEGDIAVMFDADGDGEFSEDEIDYGCTTITAAFNAVNALPTTADNQATIKLLSNVTANDIGTDLHKSYCQFDLNGYVCDIGYAQISVQGGSLTISDTRHEEVVRYFTYLGDNKYEYAEKQELIGHYYTPVKGGVMMAGGNLFTIVIQGGMDQVGHDEWEDLGDAELILDGGTYIGERSAIWLDQAKLTINQNVNLQFYCSLEEFGDGEETGLPAGTQTSVVNMSTDAGQSQIAINGGNIYGEMVYAELKGDTGRYYTIDLTDKANLPAWVNIDSAIKMVETEIGGRKVYTAAAATPENPDPITTPTEPIKETKPATNKNNMIGIIVLGAATVVMIAGVGAAIGIAVKRRKRQAA